MSSFNTWILLAAALIAPEGTFIDRSPKWQTVHADQESLLSTISSLRDSLSDFGHTELQVWALNDHNALNTHAQQNNIPITFKPFADGEFGTLAILNLQLVWAQKPTKTTCEFTNVANESSTKAKALAFNRGALIYASSTHEQPIIKIKTNSGDIACFTVADDQKIDKFFLTQKITQIRTTMCNTPLQRNCIPPYIPHSVTVVIPQFSYDGPVDIAWLNGLTCTNKQTKEYAITQAVEHLKIHVNENGCSVKAGAGLNFMPISSSQRTLTIDKPFYFWLERENVPLPLMEAYIDIDTITQ